MSLIRDEVVVKLHIVAQPERELDPSCLAGTKTRLEKARKTFPSSLAWGRGLC